MIDLFWSISKIFEPSKCNLAARPMLRPSSEGWKNFLLPSPLLLLLGRIKHGEKLRRSGPQWDASSMEKIETQWDSVGRIKLLLLWEGERGIFGTQLSNFTASQDATYEIGCVPGSNSWGPFGQPWWGGFVPSHTVCALSIGKRFGKRPFAKPG